METSGNTPAQRKLIEVSDIPQSQDEKYDGLDAPALTPGAYREVLDGREINSIEDAQQLNLEHPAPLASPYVARPTERRSTPADVPPIDNDNDLNAPARTPEEMEELRRQVREAYGDEIIGH